MPRPKTRARSPAAPRSTASLLLAPSLVRAVLLGVAAVAACVWALVRARPAVPGAPAPGAREIPAPELAPLADPAR